VDGVVVTGLAHTLGPGVPELLSSFHFANTDPRFAGQNIPDGYLTTIPGTRGGSFFYYAPGVEPAVIALDEQTKGTVTANETNGVIPALFQSGDIHVPVLVAVGDYDTLFCTAPSCTLSGSLAAETAFYAPDACLETVAIPDSGHNFNLHFEAPYAYALIQEWIGRRVGSDPRVPAPQPCQP
jgi:pimeloyl-ACP methyl ester carboxylesterase